MKFTIFIISCFIVLSNAIMVPQLRKCKKCNHIDKIGTNDFQCRRYIKLNGHIYHFLPKPPKEVFDCKYHPTVHTCHEK